MNKITNFFLVYRECLRMHGTHFFILTIMVNMNFERGFSATFHYGAISCENPQPEKPQLTEMSRRERYYDYLCVQPLSAKPGYGFFALKLLTTVENGRKGS